jgi:hypothetical protein
VRFNGSFVLVLLVEDLVSIHGTAARTIRSTCLFKHDKSVLVIQFLIHSVCQATFFLVVRCVLDDEELWGGVRRKIHDTKRDSTKVLTLLDIFHVFGLCHEFGVKSDSHGWVAASRWVGALRQIAPRSSASYIYHQGLSHLSVTASTRLLADS